MLNIRSRGGRSRVVALVLIAFLMLISACSTSSVLIPASDPTFVRARQRLEQTSRLVDASDAPISERVLFLQAESFYQYRFEPVSAGSRSFFAEAAAAATDFPAFQSLAGSLSLLDLRVRGPDAAVQLWETLLLHSPQTKLRSLTLYRLGWAYRSTAVAGLPRENPDEAFDVLIHEQPNSSLASLATEAKAVEWKSKDSAATRSLLPGLGQIYVGETGYGVLRMGIAVASAAAVAIPLYQAFHRGRDLSWNRDWPLLALGLGGLITLSFDYTSSYEDSMRGVVQWNERAEAQFNGAHREAP